MLVSQLAQRLASRPETAIATSVNDMSVDNLAATLTIGSDTFAIDEIAEKSLAKFFDIPATYLKRCPSLEKARTLNFWIDELSDADVVVHTLDSQVVAVVSAEVQALTTRQVGDVITSVFDADDRVNVLRGTDMMQFDVISESHQVDVPNPLGLPFRPEVGDITKGGVRIYIHPYTIKPPVALPYFERLVCTNGMTTEQKLGQINIKGNTVPEIIRELESRARYLMSVVDNGLAAYAETASKRIPGTLQAFAYQLGREYKLSASVMDEVMSIINQLPEDQATVYDVNQAFTEVANRGVTSGVRATLQTLGGALALQSDKMIQRCAQCERLL